MLLTLMMTPSTKAEMTNDESLLTATTAAVAIDWLQTRQIAKNPDRWYETNPLLGRHPSVGRVNSHFLSGLFLVYFSYYFLDSAEYRWLLGSILAVEVMMIGNNLRLGINVRY